MSTGLQSAEDLLAIIKASAATKELYLNKDETFVKELVEGIYSNLKRYGYGSCPCRLSSGNYEADRDILCPCVYMKEDVEKYGMCFCCLYVSKDVFDGLKPVHSIPESRPAEKTFSMVKEQAQSGPCWKCNVCGYEHYDEKPPKLCPACCVGKAFFTKSG